MRIAVTGSQGQLGLALQQVLAGHDLLLMDLPDHDVTALEPTIAAIGDFGPQVVIHCAAMTDVDGCEREPEAAHALNVLGSRNVAVASRLCEAAMVYVSTDYVFDGTRDGPYREHDAPQPLSVYGRTKAEGEDVTRHINWRHYVARVAWLYGQGPRNFVRTVLRLAREGGEMRMVTDEIGSPTYAADVAQALARLIAVPAYGIYHLSNEGTCSRYEWAREVLRLTGQDPDLVQPTQDYARAARVPKRVALYNANARALGIVMRPWREALTDFFHSDERSNVADSR